MKKITNINLGGNPIHIDEDAFEMLSDYLTKIHQLFHKHYQNTEVVDDIEIRIYEIMHENMSNRKIATIDDVNLAIQIIGKPEDIDSNIDYEAGYHTNYANFDSKHHTSYCTGKRLFRNEEDKKLGGVASGLSDYFGIDDPIWVRLIFVLSTIMGGLGLLFYFVMWVVVPPAKTASQKLEMKGKPTTLENFAEMLGDHFINITESFKDMDKFFKHKK